MSRRRKGTANVVSRSTRNFNPVGRPLNEGSRAGMCADFLRRFGEVIRCDADGHPMPDGFFWRRGGRFVLTDDEIIERAERLGFDPDGWKRVTPSPLSAQSEVRANG